MLTLMAGLQHFGTVTLSSSSQI